MGEVIEADQAEIVAVDLAVGERLGALHGGLGAGKRAALGFQVQGRLLRAHGRIDRDFPFSVDGHAGLR